MGILLDLIFNLTLICIYFIIAIFLGIVVQLISYRVFKFNLYKKVMYLLFVKEW